MICATTYKGKPFYYLEERQFKAKKGLATLIGVEKREQDTLLMLKYDTGEREDILISTIVKLCQQKGIPIKNT